MGARLRLRPDFRTACRRREGRASQVCHVSSYERVRARQVALSRAIFLFLCPGTFGRVLSYLVISCRILSSFFVPKWFFRAWRAAGGCGTGSGGVLIHENQVNCGPIVARGDLHPSPPGAVLQQAREPKLAAGETAATPGTRSPKIWDAASRSPLLRDRANGAILFSYLSEDVIERVPFGQEREGFSYERGVSGLPQLRPGCGDGGAPLQRMRLQYPGWLSA